MTTTTVRVRWMIRKDLPAVLAIENDSFQFPWSEEDFIRCLRQRNCIGMVAKSGEQIAGFMIYELCNNSTDLLTFAVNPRFRRSGYGRAMIEKLISKLSCSRRRFIWLTVRETNLTAQLFFKSMGFRATSVMKGFYTDTPEDAYVMAYRYRKQPE